LFPGWYIDDTVSTGGPPKRRLLRRQDLHNRGIAWSNVHQIKLEREGRFPKRVYLTPAKCAWVEDEVDAWIEARIAERA